ncbi:MAG: hypothetical protein SGILL_010348 [Bacillariaceae sp.]
MYQDKQFKAKALEDIEAELKLVNATLQEITTQNSGDDNNNKPSDYIRDVFLADGDAMTLPQSQLLKILKLIQQHLPHVRRVSSYCLPRNIRYNKSVEDLKVLKQYGLSLVYVGCESGNDQVLEAVNKGETFDTSVDALWKLKEASIKRSVMILLGLGGTALSEAHAMDSAKLCSEAEPEFLSVLTTSFPRGTGRVDEGYEKLSTVKDGKGIQFQTQTARESLEELQVFLEHLDISPSARTIFRSDHASNYFVLKGRLGRDKDRLVREVRSVLEAPEEEDRYNLRPEWARGL